MTKIFTHAAALGLCLSVALPAVAAEPDLPQAIVKIADLDLTTAAGEQTLNRRIANAAAHVCGIADGRDLSAKPYIKACRVAAIASTGPQLETVLASVRSGKGYSVASLTVATPKF